MSTSTSMPGGTSAPAPADKFVARTQRHFALAEFLKPDEATASREEVLLAPLIVLETAPGRTSPMRPLPAVGQGSDKNPRPACVYVDERVAALSGRDCRQMTHLWRIPSGRRNDDALWVGVRTTFGADGFPAVWEWIDPREDVSLIFVSARVEQAAAKEFGPPLQGRRFSVERDAATHENIAVPRLMEEGPEPLGPYVYLDENAGLMTLACRCAASQVSEFSESVYYRLIPAAELEAAAEKQLGGQGIDELLPRKLDENGERNRLDLILRLPADW